LGASVLGLWGLVPSDLWLLVPREGRWGLVGIAAGFLAWVLPSLWALLRVHRAARWLALVSLGGTVASAWGVPADRALFVAGLGSWPLIALWIGAWRERPAWWPASGWRGKRAAGLATGWVLVHGVVAPSLLPLRAMSHGFLGESFGRLAAWLPDDPALPSQTLVVLRGPDALSAGAVPALRALEGRPSPAHVRVLSVEPGGFEVRRVGPQSVELVRPEGFGENPSVELLGPSWGEAWAAGRWEVEGLRVEVVARAPDASAAPTRLRFAWSTPWARLRWVVWTDEGWAELEPPQVGGAAQVPAMDARRVFER
jgi:hypothetical protein